MSIVSVPDRPPSPLRAIVAEEVRALLARRRMSAVALAAAIGKSQSYVSRRLTGDTAFDLDDLDAIARATGVGVTTLLGPGGGRPVTGEYADRLVDDMAA